MDNENDRFTLNPNLKQSYATGITNWFISKGLVKDQKSAEVLMVIISIICLAVAVYFIIK